MNATAESPKLSGAKVEVVIEASTYNGKKITACKVFNIRHQNEAFEQVIKDGWELVQIVWVREENTNYGQAPAVNHVLKAVVVKTERTEVLQ